MRHVLPFFVLLCLYLPVTLWAEHGGGVRGLVTNRAGEPLVGASVRLEEKKWLLATDEIGVFAFSDLPGGAYTLTVSYLGYQGARLQVQVNDHETTNTRIVLEEKKIDLGDVEIAAARGNPLQTIGQLDIRLRPLQSSQDILRQVPGLFIAQHAGGGKAEQIFLRGFDIDHGTDIALFVDGIPVNMVSHAHGQGYADLHFLIPELVQRVDFQKGLYDARTGNFATAGQVRFETPVALDKNFVQVEAGQFDSYRLVSAVDLLGKNAAARGLNAYLAGEQVFSNAWFDAPQQFRRQNYFAKISHTPDDRQSFSLSLSAFSSSWLASGQIPERAVARGLIGYFGAIDPTEGGATTRYNLNAEHVFALSNNTAITNQLYYSKYDFELYSNFTFFLEDPLRGDQIRQKESRGMTGYNGRIQHRMRLGNQLLEWEGGLQYRGDQVSDIELSRTFQRREALQRLAWGDLQEMNVGAYGQGAWHISPAWTLELGGRYDHFRYYYENALDSLFRPASTVRSQWSPKVNLQWQAGKNVQLFLRYGAGFHSNDTRVVLFSADQNILPSARGVDAGLYWQPWQRLLLHGAFWRLDLEQELVYVGDAGIVEPGGQTRRYGLDATLRWQLGNHLFLDGDYTWTRARTLDAPEGERHVPLAPVHTAAAGLQWVSPTLSAGIRGRWLGDRPANEDYSLTARGYLIFDAQIAVSPAFAGGKRPLEFRLSAQNLTNTRWYEAQFETESRLRDEAAPVSEIHFTPGTPFFAKAAIVFKF